MLQDTSPLELDFETTSLDQNMFSGKLVFESRATVFSAGILRQDLKMNVHKSSLSNLTETELCSTERNVQALSMQSCHALKKLGVTTARWVSPMY